LKELDLDKLDQEIRRTLIEFGFEGEFKPFAFYDRYNPLGSNIVVQTADCSICEHEVDPILTLFERNHIEEGQARFVGFRIEGAYSFERDEFMPDNKLSVSLILSAISLGASPKTKGAIREVCLPIIEDFKLDKVGIPA